MTSPGDYRLSSRIDFSLFIMAVSESNDYNAYFSTKKKICIELPKYTVNKFSINYIFRIKKVLL